MVFLEPSVYLDSMDLPISYECQPVQRCAHWVYMSSKPWDEYTFVPWLNKKAYRRIVDLSRINLQ
jgi:hypothetical protein